jgi:hypothetical protein
MVNRSRRAPFSRLFYALFLGPICALFYPGLASAGIELLAITGDVQPGGSARLSGVSTAAINSSGEVTFRATLQQGLGGVTSTNDKAIWRVHGPAKQVLARTGSSGPSGDVFTAFQSVSIGDGGEVVVAATATAKQGLWRYPTAPGTGATIALTATPSVPGVPGANFESLGTAFLHAPSDVAAYAGKMVVGLGGVTGNSDRGLWLDAAGQPSLLVREHFSSVPGNDGAEYAAFSASAVNDQSQVAILGTLAIGPGDVTFDNSLGIWRIGSASGEAIARRLSGNVGGVPGTFYDALGPPTINDSGHVAFRGRLVGDVTAANNQGIWIHDAAESRLLVRTGVGGVPGVAGADFSVLSDLDAPELLLNDANQLLMQATMAVGPGGVAANDATGLWIVDSDGGGSLIARTGSGGVPGVAGANYSAFSALSFNDAGIAAVRATLEIGPGGVTTGAETGLWLLDAGGGGTLVARTGGTLVGRTIAALEFTGGSAGGDGRQRSLNSAGQLVFKATFTNGDEGLFRYTPASTADFNGDGTVNSADLARWKAGFGTISAALSSQGDADRDGDVDGADFLAWQRQLSGGGGALEAVPEPASGVMLLFGMLVGGLRWSGGLDQRKIN